MNVEFRVFARLVVRCGEIAGQPGAPQVLLAVYQAACEQPLARFLNAMTAVDDATTRASEAITRRERGLEEMDRQLRIGRSAVACVLPGTKLPATLKKQPTDTDKRSAIQRLVDLITPHAGQPWADALLQGVFGQTAAKAIQQINEAIEAQNALQKAKTERSQAFQPAWDAYIRFKQLVRDTLGSTARQYRRIHLRNASPAEEEETPALAETTAALSEPAPAGSSETRTSRPIKTRVTASSGVSGSANPPAARTTDRAEARQGLCAARIVEHVPASRSVLRARDASRGHQTADPGGSGRSRGGCQHRRRDRAPLLSRQS